MATKKAWYCVCVAVALVSPTLWADEPDKKLEPKKTVHQPSGWMKLKLEYSQKILAGIAEADFDSIVQNAEAMQGLTTIEGFVRSRTPGYSTQLEFFKDANAELIKQGKKDSVEGAALAFTQMTLSCVNCHKRLREAPNPPSK